MPALFSILALLLSVAAPQWRAYAFVDLSVIPMDRERVLEHQTVIVRDGRIAQIGAAGDVEVPRDATRIVSSPRASCPQAQAMRRRLRCSPME
jgi:hypothetical protein